ncbi:MAG: helix-turn-helix domain-containing protein [bacterium]
MDDTLTAKLQTLGLTKSESQLYLTILELGKTNVAKLSRHTRINRRNIYDSLSTLLDKGLVFQIVQEQEGIYSAVAPDKIAELIEAKEIALMKIMPELKEQFVSKKVREKAIIYKGVEGFKKYLRDILLVSQDIYCLGAKGGWGYDKLGSFANQFESERVNKKLKAHNLFDYEMQEIINTKQASYNQYGEHRFLPKEFSTNSAIDVFGDHVVTFTGLYPERFEDNVTLFVFISKDLAEAGRTWFQCMWDICDPGEK